MLGNSLRRAREDGGMTQEQLADRAGLHRTHVSVLERDKKSPTVDILLSVCRALDVLPSTILRLVELDSH
jgi:transcriptional regulator with XRE-family HTH domain